MDKIKALEIITMDISSNFGAKHIRTASADEADTYVFDVKDYQDNTGKITVQLWKTTVNVIAEMHGFMRRHEVFEFDNVHEGLLWLNKIRCEHCQIKRLRKFMEMQDFSYADIVRWNYMGDLKDFKD